MPLAAALLVGMAAASKAQGLVLAAATAAGFAAGCLAARRRPGWALRSLLTVGGGIAVIGLPWWIRSWVHTGSPLHPFFLRGNPDIQALFAVSARYGMGRGLVDFLLLPWRIATNAPGPFGDPFNMGVPALLLPLVLVLVLLKRRRWSPECVFLAVAVAMFVVLWFRTGQQIRYLTSLLPLAVLLFVWALPVVGAGRRTTLLLNVALGLLAARGMLVTSTCFRLTFPPPVRHADRETLLSATLPGYQAVRELNTVLAPGDRTYLLFAEECRFNIKGVSYGDWLGDFSYAWLTKDVGNAEQLIARLSQAGFHYAIVSLDRAVRHRETIGEWFSKSEFVQPLAPIPGAQRVYSDRNFAVLRFTRWRP